VSPARAFGALFGLLLLTSPALAWDEDDDLLGDEDEEDELPPLSSGDDEPSDDDAPPPPEEELPDPDDASIEDIVREKEPAPKDGLRPLLDIEVGGGMQTFGREIGAAFRPHLGVGYTLPMLAGRIRLGGEVGWTRPSYTGVLDDPRMTDPIPWSVQLHALDVGAPVAFSVWGEGRDVDVEFLAVPKVAWFHAKEAVGTEDDPYGTTRESYFKPGITLGAGIVGPIGRGELAAHLGVTVLDPGGILTGPTGSATPFLTLRYRLALLQRS